MLLWRLREPAPPPHDVGEEPACEGRLIVAILLLGCRLACRRLGRLWQPGSFQRGVPAANRVRQ